MPENIFLFENGQQLGPFSSRQVTEFIQTQRFNQTTLAWFEGLPAWQPLGEACPEIFHQASHMAPTVPHWQPGQPAHAPGGGQPYQAQAAAGYQQPAGHQAQAAQAPQQQWAQQPQAAQQPWQPQQQQAPQAQQVQQAQPQMQQPQLQQPQPAPYTPPKTTFEVITKGFCRMPKITMENEEVILESGALHYLIGNIEIESKLPSVGGAFKSMLSGENMVRPRYRGTGEIFLEPTFGEVNIMELHNEEWIFDRGAFLASDRTVEVDMYSNKAFAGFFGGEGFFQTIVRGSGKVFYLSPGPVEKIELNGAKTLVVDGSFAVARSVSLDYTVERATRKLFGSMTSGEGLVSKFRGVGTVYIAPIPNDYMVFSDSFTSLRTTIAKGLAK